MAPRQPMSPGSCPSRAGLNSPSRAREAAASGPQGPRAPPPGTFWGTFQGPGPCCDGVSASRARQGQGAFREGLPCRSRSHTAPASACVSRSLHSAPRCRLSLWAGPLQPGVQLSPGTTPHGGLGLGGTWGRRAHVPSQSLLWKARREAYGQMGPGVVALQLGTHRTAGTNSLAA